MRDKCFCLSQPASHLIGFEYDQISIVAFLAAFEQQVKMFPHFLR